MDYLIDDTTDVSQGVEMHTTGDPTGQGAWHARVSSNTYAWLIIMLALAGLWGLGRAFRSVRS